MWTGVSLVYWNLCYIETAIFDSILGAMCRSDGPLLMRDDVVTNLSAPHFLSMALTSFRSRRLLLAVVFGGVRLERKPGKPKLSSSSVVHVYSSARAHLTHAALTSIAISNRILSASLIPKSVSKWYFDSWISLCHVNISTNLIQCFSWRHYFLRRKKKCKCSACISTTANYMHIYNGSRFGAIGEKKANFSR